MNKLRIIILTPIPFWHPGTTELIDGLNKKGYTVISLDIWSFKFYDESGVIHNLVTGLFRGKLERIYKRVFRNRVIKKYIKEGDIVDIHWCGHYYSKYIEKIKKQNVKVFATLFGSDLYRNTPENRVIQRKIFEVADKIVMGVNMQDDFEQHFNGFTDKILFAQYGSARLDLIDDLASRGEGYILHIRKKYGISPGKIVVTVGYNSKPEQQHILFLEKLVNADINLKNKLFLLLPLTYGAETGTSYYKELKLLLLNLNIEYLCLEKRLTDEELAETKLISDITVNLQVTDALSSSIKEAMAANNVLLVGDWLPYEVYEELGIYFIRSGLNDFERNFMEIVKNLDYYKGKCGSNASIVIRFASWKYIIPQFICNYNS